MRRRAQRGQGPAGRALRLGRHPGFLTLAFVSILRGTLIHAAQAEPLVLESKIPLPDVKGRIDHLAVDVARQRLYVAELGNNSVGVVDLKEHKLLRTLHGFREPQGIAYEPSTDTVYVASGGDGSVRLLRGEDLTSAGAIELGEDADNIRIDMSSHRVLVGYGNGALAVIDPARRQKIADIPLKAHPESFQVEPQGGRIFVNVSDANEVAVVALVTGKQTSTWATKNLRANFPLAIDAERQQVLAVFRHPATLGAFNIRDGGMTHAVEACGDSDDLFVDAKRSQIYISCGEGFLDVFAARADGFVRVAHLATAAGARTSLWVPQLDRLFLAVRAVNDPAAIWIFRPAH
jgi:DNA-binding beta-propeller fold protein YncE